MLPGFSSEWDDNISNGMRQKEEDMLGTGCLSCSCIEFEGSVA